MKYFFPPSTALAAAFFVVTVLKPGAAEGDNNNKHTKKRLNGLKGTHDPRDLMMMSMATIEGIMPGIPGQPAPALTPDLTPDFSVAFLEQICPKPPTPPPPPVVDPGTWVTPVDVENPWSIVQCDDAPGGSSMCYKAFDDQEEYRFDYRYCPIVTNIAYCDCRPSDGLVVDKYTDVKVVSKKKRKPENHDGIEAIQHSQSSTLENTYDFPTDGFLVFNLFCSSEAFSDYCSVYVDGLDADNEVISTSGDVGWKKMSIAVSKGPHTIYWRYQKDCACSCCQDTMKLDDISFVPLGNVVVEVDNFD